MNDVPDGYNISKLFTEDPVSVSRQFSQEFHAMFQQVVMKGEVLGQVEHSNWKKEYQQRGAPHYHVLVWIRGASVVGKDDPDKVLAWIKERISCQIPNRDTVPELYDLVMRYQLHKCTGYCNKKVKHGSSIFVIRCKFGYPRPSSKTAQLHCVDEN